MGHVHQVARVGHGLATKPSPPRHLGTLLQRLLFVQLVYRHLGLGTSLGLHFSCERSSSFVHVNTFYAFLLSYVSPS